LLIGERVAERIKGTVEVAQPIGDVVQYGRDTGVGVVTETHDHRKNVPRSPAQDERTQDDRDCTQGLPRSILVLLLLLVTLAKSHLTLGVTTPATASLKGTIDRLKVQCSLIKREIILLVYSSCELLIENISIV